MPPHEAAGVSAGMCVLEDDDVVSERRRQERKGAAGEAKDFTVDDFCPLRAVGNGDMGTVFLVKNVRDAAPYAMKVMKKAELKKRDTFFRAEMERDILACLNHPFLPSLFAHFETKEHRFLVMDYCAGGDLNVLRQQQAEKRFSEAAARFYASEVVLALEYLHEKDIIYRDLKPENILIKEDGHTMLADFDLSARAIGNKYVTTAIVINAVKPASKKRSGGISNFFACGSPGGSHSSKSNGMARVRPVEGFFQREAKKESVRGRNHSFVGTEEYVAPEVVWGTGHGKAVDWWTLGILIYEMICGKTPFKGETRKNTFVNIMCNDVVFPGPPSPLKDLVEKLLIKDPLRRLGSTFGAAEIKSHPFFRGLKWDSIQFVSRPPHVPPPFSMEEEEAERATSLANDAVAGEDVSEGSSGCSRNRASRMKEDMHLAVQEIGSSSSTDLQQSVIESPEEAENQLRILPAQKASSANISVERDRHLRDLPVRSTSTTRREDGAVGNLFDDTF